MKHCRTRFGARQHPLILFPRPRLQASATNGEAGAAEAGTSAAPPPAPPPVNAPLGKASPYVYEPHFGLPVVQQRLHTSELLRDLREGKVAEVKWFADQSSYFVEGPCIVIYKDGTLKQANVPPVDIRTRYAMETHAVHNGLLPAPPSQEDMALPFDFGKFGEVLLAGLPFLLILFIWGLVQGKDLMKGDAADRAQIKRKAREDKKRSDQQSQEDRKILNIAQMVNQNWADEDIRADIKNSFKRSPLSDDEVTALIEEARRAKKLRESGKRSLKEDEERDMARARAATAAAASASEDSSLEGGNSSRREVSGNEAGGGSAGAGGLARMSSMRIRGARLREVNRTRLKGRLKNLDDTDIFFADVAGIDAAKRELEEVVLFFNRPEHFAKSGARAPRGVLLYGPPGTGKTLLARAVAGEANATFVGVNASEFVEMFVGVGAARVRDLFAVARENAPAVIFIDEIDAVGRTRGASMGNDERDQTLNQMLSEMDGFDERANIVVIAATNRQDVLDPALVRPGRFDRQIHVGLPNLEGRIEVFKVHLNKRKWDPNSIRLSELAFKTQQFSGAMIANLVNVASLKCARRGGDTLLQEDLEAALDEERVGLRRPPYNLEITRRIAVVEGATAVVAALMPAIEPLVRVTAQPSEKAPMGQTVLKVDEQRELSQLFTARYLREQLLMVLAGRAAELLEWGEPSTLIARNLGFARRIVNKLVAAAAMTDDPGVGPRVVASVVASADGLAQVVSSRVSVVTQAHVDLEMERLLAEADREACALLERNRALLSAVVERLCAEPYELQGAEVEALAAELAHPDDLRRRQEGLSVEAYI